MTLRWCTPQKAAQLAHAQFDIDWFRAILYCVIDVLLSAISNKHLASYSIYFFTRKSILICGKATVETIIIGLKWQLKLAVWMKVNGRTKKA